MFPFFEILPGIFLYTFGLTLTACFFLFLWNLKRLSKRFGYSFSFFTQNIVWFFLSIFLFSRIFYVLGKWNDMKFIKDPGQFFIMSEFNFSLFWAMFGFGIVLYFLTRLEKSSLLRYIDGVVLSFLFIMVVWYIGSLFGGQVYGRETMIGIELLYSHPHSLVASQVPVFPLPIVYTLMSFIIFSGMYILSLFVHIRGYIGYMGLILFWAMILIFESFSGKQDILSVSSMFNLPQVFALILIIWSSYQFSKIFKNEGDKETHLEV